MFQRRMASIQAAIDLSLLVDNVPLQNIGG